MIFFLVVQDIDFASYADDKTIYATGQIINEIILPLQESRKNLLKWFADNQIKNKGGKGHLLSAQMTLLRFK